MTGWQRFFLLLVCCVGVLILWPQYNSDGLMFMAGAFLLWTCMIILLSVLGNVFALYKFEFLNRFISLLYLGVMLASLLYYFPLPDDQTPMGRLRQNVWPTVQDAKDGMKRLTFNFDFVRRHVHRDANYVNQKLDDTSKKAAEIKKSLQKKKEKLDIVVEKWGEGEKE